MSSDVKTIIIPNYEAGKSYSEIGRMFQLNRATVYAVVTRYRERGDIENRPRSGRKKKLDDRDTRKLLRLVKNNRLLPLQDITRKFNENLASLFDVVCTEIISTGELYGKILESEKQM